MIVLVLSLGFWVGCGSDAPPVAAGPDVTETQGPDPGLLLTIMVGLGADVDEISRGLWIEDLGVVGAGALAIAEHPHVSDPERERIQGVLGAEFADFVQSDHRVHDAAVRLSEAAAAGDMTATLDELAQLQAGCVACHQVFRERLR
jgi:cytochrome c553